MSNPPENRRKWSGAMAIGAYVPAVARRSFETHGFSTSSILSDWPEIIGEEFASITAPERIVWPREHAGFHPDDERERQRTHRKSGATLVMRVDGPRALEIQHMTSQLLERINIYFGYNAVQELRIVQGPVSKKAGTAHAASKGVEPEFEEPANVGTIEDDSLRRALTRLQGRVKA